MLHNKNLGNLGEDYACKFLCRKGYKIIRRNVYIGKGEIDIIAKYKGVLVFIEVKAREGDEYIDLLDALDKDKCERLIDICEEYLSINKLEDVDWRVDLIGIIARNGRVLKARHFKGIV